jgi:hypothetical protein
MNPTPSIAPWNLALRFGLELAALVGLAAGGWSLFSQPASWFAAIVLPAIGAVVWGVFNVPDDPSRSGGAPVRVPGVIRLVLEVLVLAAGAAGFALAGQIWLAALVVALAVFHYATTLERMRWLLAR